MALAASHGSSFAVREDGILLAWGDNEFGALGTGNIVDTNAPNHVSQAIGEGGAPLTWDSRPEARVRQVSTRWKRTGIVTDAGDLFMCGIGNNGELGLVQQDAIEAIDVWDEYIVMTPTLVPRAMFAGEGVLMVACGGNFTVVATEGGIVYTFGFGGDGALGHGGEQSEYLPRQVREIRCLLVKPMGAAAERAGQSL